jgi:hypothetical protein
MNISNGFYNVNGAEMIDSSDRLRQSLTSEYMACLALQLQAHRLLWLVRQLPG